MAIAENMMRKYLKGQLPTVVEYQDSTGAVITKEEYDRLNTPVPVAPAPKVYKDSAGNEISAEQYQQLMARVNDAQRNAAMPEMQRRAMETYTRLVSGGMTPAAATARARMNYVYFTPPSVPAPRKTVINVKKLPKRKPLNGLGELPTSKLMIAAAAIGGYFLLKNSR